MTDYLDALAGLPGTAQTLPAPPAPMTGGYLAKPSENAIVDLPPRPVETALFTDEAFEAWWTQGLVASIHSRDLDSLKLVLALALKNGLT